MKKALLAITAVLVLATFAGVALAGNFHKNASGKETDNWAPVAFYAYSSTKSPMTHPTAGKYAIRFQPDADITYKQNGTGVGYPVSSGVNEGPMGTATAEGAGRNITSIVFYVTSSATRKRVYVQEQ